MYQKSSSQLSAQYIAFWSNAKAPTKLPIQDSTLFTNIQRNIHSIIDNKSQPIYQTYVNFLRKRWLHAQSIDSIKNALGITLDENEKKALSSCKESIRNWDYKQHSAFLGEWDNGVGFFVHIKWKKHVVKIPKDKQTKTLSSFNYEIATYAYSSGISNIPSLVWIIPDDFILVLTFVEGTRLDKLNDDNSYLNENTLIKFFQLIEQLSERNIWLDNQNRGNILYDPFQNSLNVVDPHYHKQGVRLQREFVDSVNTLVPTWNNLEEHIEHMKFRIFALEIMQQKLPNMYKKIIELSPKNEWWIDIFSGHVMNGFRYAWEKYGLDIYPLEELRKRELAMQNL